MVIVMKFFYFLWMIVGIAVIVLVSYSIIDSARNGRINIWLNEMKNKYNEKRLVKDISKKKIKKHNKKKDCINFEALKFEYNEICTIVNDVASKLNLDNYSEIYILKFDEYIKRKDLYGDKFCGKYSLYKIACLVKSLLEEPIVRITSGSINNITVIENVIEAFQKHKIKYYNYTILDSYTKDEILLEMQDKFRLYGDDVFLIAMYIIEKIY